MAAARPARATAPVTAAAATGGGATSSEPSSAADPSSATPASAPAPEGADAGPGLSDSTTTSAPVQASAALSASSAPGDPPRRGTGRKRAASIDTEEANRSRIENLTLTTPSSAGLICLCAPEPKVPRPRNAFILYRQHHQAQVVQQHPGLANPEISKIIGEQWRDEPEERKLQWKQLAEEEKQHHQRKYPDYRYQPRRGNKGGAAGTGGGHSGRTAAEGTGTPGGDPHRCPKCNGRYIATPRTPSTPYPTPTTARPPQTPIGGLAQAQSSSLSSSLRSTFSSSSRTADMSRHPQSRSHPPPPPPTWAGNFTSSSNQGSGELYDIPENREGTDASPNGPSKRRRYREPADSSNIKTISANYHHVSPALSSPAPGTYPQPPRHYHNYQSQHTRRIRTNGHSNHMEEDPISTNRSDSRRYKHSSLVRPGHQRRVMLAGSAPLRASAPAQGLVLSLQKYHAKARAPESGHRSGTDPSPKTTQSERNAEMRSVEAMVMSIPFVNKLRVLERISPPLRTRVGRVSARGNGGLDRGPVIAIEGPDARLVRAVSAVVERALKEAAPPPVGGTEGAGTWELRLWEDESTNLPPVWTREQYPS
ncbi:hypothetical protein VTJ49DRAFT_5584 [Mycothermus thermophilus]|uniref:HMG box domain-containing protein n=1 Tax=Humicola insolens TaxID=85995 RepID=A0ABR3VK83_HUMIN